jgi:hypothetical protein
MATNAVSTLSGFFKTTYGDKVVQAIPDHCIIQKEKLFNFTAPVEQVGEQYVMPVTMKHPHGFTYANANADAFALNPVQSGKTEKAIVTANQMVLRDAISKEAVSLSLKGGEVAFGKVTAHVVKRMIESAKKRLEIELLYGQQSLATVSSLSTNTITVTAATWAAGIWIGSEGASVDVYNGATKRGSATITAVDPDAKTITLDAAPAGTTTNDLVWWKDSKGNQMAGMYTILANTGTLFNISATTYSLWKGNSVAAGGNLSLALVNKLAERNLNKGAGQSFVLLVNPGSWRALVSTEAGLRSYDKSYDPKQAEDGFETIKFHSLNCQVKVLTHPMVKEGDAFLVDPQSWYRVGSQDWTFDRDVDGSTGVYFRDLENNAGFELRMYTNQCAFSERPGSSGIFTGVTSAA